MKAKALAKRKSPGVTGLSFQEFPSMESATLARVPPARKALSLGSSMENYWCAARLMSRREASRPISWASPDSRSISHDCARIGPSAAGGSRPSRRFFRATVSSSSSRSGIPRGGVPVSSPSSWMVSAPRGCLIASSRRFAPASVTA